MPHTIAMAPKITPIMDRTRPVFNAPKLTYFIGFIRYIIIGFLDNAKPIMPQIKPTNTHPNRIEQMPKMSTAVAFGNFSNCWLVVRGWFSIAFLF